MAALAQKLRLVVWVLVGMTLSSSLTGSRLASAQAPSEVARLMTQLHDESPKVRWYAADALGVIGPAAKDAVPELARLLKDSDGNVRGSAAFALVPKAAVERQ